MDDGTLRKFLSVCFVEVRTGAEILEVRSQRRCEDQLGDWGRHWVRGCWQSQNENI